MLSRIWIINLVLAALIFVSWVGIWSIRHTGGPPIPDMNDCPSPDITAEKPRKAEKKLPEPSEYNAIVEKNLFSPERATHITPEDAPVVAEELKISGEKVMLYGVVMIGDYKSALINNPSKDKDGREYRWVKEGEKINNLKVVAIKDQYVVLSDDQLQYKISLYDAKKKQTKEDVKKPTTAPEINKSSKEASPENVVVGSEAPVKKQPVEPPKKGPEAEPEKPKNNQKTSDNDYEIVDTPFGQIRKKIKQ
jgi:hypothetical protein